MDEDEGMRGKDTKTRNREGIRKTDVDEIRKTEQKRKEKKQRIAYITGNSSKDRGKKQLSEWTKAKGLRAKNNNTGEKKLSKRNVYRKKM